VRIDHVLETHTHADHVSGHGRLASATGARVHVHRAAGAEYEHEAIDDGWVLELGAVRVRALHTPGHRPEHTAYLLTDTARGAEPWAVLTGDSLFVGDVARPDLAVDKEEGARGVFHSLHEQLLSLPDDVEVWPGHLGGSLCGGPGMDLKVATTIGFERAHNALLQVADEDAFVEGALASLGPQPPNFENIVALNRGPFSTASADPHPLTPRQVDQARRDGALLVDLRTDEQFDDAHIPGSVAITMLRAGFGSKLAWLAEPEQPVILIGRHDDDASDGAGLAESVGITNVTGFLSGGMTSWREEAREVGRTERIGVRELLERRDRVQLLDVRETSEWRDRRIPGSVHVPYHDIHALPDGLDPARPIAVICASGQRAAVGASLVSRYGAEDVIHVVGGGVGTWEREGGAVERD
jgi:rhodanese-related sulfurtransferase/glyoxylase-like metal-dependent hydrolase (beta-lactamase superfamily II)